MLKDIMQTMAPNVVVFCPTHHHAAEIAEHLKPYACRQRGVRNMQIVGKNVFITVPYNIYEYTGINQIAYLFHSQFYELADPELLANSERIMQR